MAVKSIKKVRENLKDCFAALENNIDNTKLITEEYFRATDKLKGSIIRPTKAMQHLKVFRFTSKLEQLAERQQHMRDERREAKPRDKAAKNVDNYEFITHEASEKRLILLGSIFALCLLTLATAFVAITIKLFMRFKIPVVLNYKAEPREISGFPYPAILLILDSGNITEFSTISSSAKNERNGLPGLDKLPSRMFENIFAFERLGHIYFLSTNTQRNVIKYDIYGKHYRVIGDSKINNKHTTIYKPNNYINDDYLNFKPHGVQIGEFYWIILGSNTGCFS